MTGKHRYRNGRCDRERGKASGQAVVEFALVMFLFLMFLLAVIDLGRAYFTTVGLENAASEGALFGMANPNCKTLAEGAANCGSQENSVEYRVKYESKTALLDPSQVTYQVQMDPIDPGAPGTAIRVTVFYPFRPILPVLSAFGAGAITLNQSADQLIP